MTFALTWKNSPNATEERDKRILALFTKWSPPAGFEFKAFYDYADGDGGVAIVEASSAEAIYEAIAPWATFLTFRIRPVIATEKSVPILQKAIAWRDSIR
jgi:hypothetical protein